MKLNPIIILGLILALIGLVALGWQGVGYQATHDWVLEFGPLAISAGRLGVIPVAPLVSGAVLVAGVILIAVGAASKRAT